MDYTIQQRRFGKTTVSFACAICGEPLVAPLDDAGTQQTCPKCGSPFVTPGEKELHEQKLAAAQKDQQAKHEAAARRSREAALQELRGERARAAVAEPPAALGASPSPPQKVTAPRYAVLNVAANTIMLLGMIGAFLEILLGLFIVLASVLAPPGRDPFAQSLHATMMASGITFGLLLVGVGLITGIFTIAFAQLLLAVRDMAINSFHIRNALSLPTP